VDDFTITGLSGIVGKVEPVGIDSRGGKRSDGTITRYYEGIDGTDYQSTVEPQAEGKYAVTFLVAEVKNWSEVLLPAGTLVVEPQPNFVRNPHWFDFNIDPPDGKWEVVYDGDPKPVSITPKSDDSSQFSQGKVTPKYKGSITPPTNVGSYAVTFDVAEAVGWNAARNLPAETLTITPATPVRSDFYVRGLWEAVHDGIQW
jgi:hypothetical protein